MHLPRWRHHLLQKKSLSVRCDRDGRSTIHIKRGQNKYESLSNFYFQIKHFVAFEDRLSRYNDYLMDVERNDAVKM